MTGIKGEWKNEKDIFTRMTRLRNNAGQFWTIADEKQMELKEIPEDWLKSKNLSTQNKKMWTLRDDPSLPFILPLLWPAVFPELSPAAAEAYLLFPRCPSC